MLIKQKNPHGGDIWNRKYKLDFSASINPYGMPDSVKNAVIDAVCSKEAICYPDVYCGHLREKIAEKEMLEKDCILCGNGASELIYSFTYSLRGGCQPLIISPTFNEYERALEAAGIRSRYYQLRKTEEFRLTDEILDEIGEDCGAVFVCSPNNPTGITVRPELLWRMAEKCQKTNTRLFCDFSFMDLSNQAFADETKWISDNPNVFVLKAFTKSYGMAGIRLGYALCTDKKFLGKVSEKAPCWNVSLIAQKAGIAALEEKDYVEKCRQKLQFQRERIKEQLLDMGISVYPGEANFLLLESRLPLSKRLAQRGILVRNCANYPFLDETFLRIAIRTKEENDILMQEIWKIVREETEGR